MELLQPYFPAFLCAAMLSRQLVNPPFQRLPQPEIVPIDGQNLIGADRVEHPVGELHFNVKHPAIETFADDRGAIY